MPDVEVKHPKTNASQETTTLYDSAYVAIQQDDLTSLTYDVINTVQPSNMSTNTSSMDSGKTHEFHFHYAYFILGTMFFLSAVLMTIAWTVGDRFSVRAPLLYVQSDAATKTRLNKRQTRTILLLMSVFHFFHMGLEMSYKALLLAFSVATLGFSRRSGAWLVSTCYLSYTIGRGKHILL